MNKDTVEKSEEYNGWKNYETWNVALWIGNDYPLYRASEGYKTYGTPYLSFRYDLRESFGFTKTRDGVSLWDKSLDIAALDEMIKEV
jgi:hypothetical protein